MPSLHIGEIILRGTIVYLFLFLLLRSMRRQAGAIGIADLLVVVLIASAAQNAMTSQYKSVTEGLILVSTIASCDYLLNWLAFKFRSLRRLLYPPPLLLIKDGRIQWRNLRRELMTEEELMEKLREQGVESIEDVKESYLESDGTISVITKEPRRRHRRPPKKVP